MDLGARIRHLKSVSGLRNSVRKCTVLMTDPSSWLFIELQVEALSVSPDGTLMATGGHDMQIVLSSLDVSLSQVDALPLDEPGDDSVNYGAMLWQKYTRKVIEKSQSKSKDTH